MHCLQGSVYWCAAKELTLAVMEFCFSLLLIKTSCLEQMKGNNDGNLCFSNDCGWTEGSYWRKWHPCEPGGLADEWLMKSSYQDAGFREIRKNDGGRLEGRRGAWKGVFQLWAGWQGSFGRQPGSMAWARRGGAYVIFPLLDSSRRPWPSFEDKGTMRNPSTPLPLCPVHPHIRHFFL